MDFEYILLIAGAVWWLGRIVYNRRKKAREIKPPKPKPGLYQSDAPENRGYQTASRQTDEYAPRQQSEGLPRKAKAGAGLFGDLFDQLQRELIQEPPKPKQSPMSAAKERAERPPQYRPAPEPPVKPKPQPKQAEEEVYEVVRSSGEAAFSNREDLVRGIIMAEILGPPRAQKKRSLNARG